MKITVLRSAGCIEGDTCPMIGRVDTDPAWLRMVVIPETDPAVLVEFACYVGPGEIVAKFPAEQLPEVQ